ncbi:hypothetical protein KSS94_05265 [Pseudomonas fakonensis]|uniref:Uncharacterized protein n=1 Tax=Pseudomonas fakonensis TaxID=2842355 RepID=A0ABX8N9M3_9PSED|nr:hypothetical protein [Pseudomonas fakonensis]QXH52540.1 hypothetical protein KSS94_05265 [Pseudomonas fakonensis]
MFYESWLASDEALTGAAKEMACTMIGHAATFLFDKRTMSFATNCAAHAR